MNPNSTSSINPARATPLTPALLFMALVLTGCETTRPVAGRPVRMTADLAVPQSNRLASAPSAGAISDQNKTTAQQQSPLLRSFFPPPTFSSFIKWLEHIVENPKSHARSISYAIYLRTASVLK